MVSETSKATCVAEPGVPGPEGGWVGCVVPLRRGPKYLEQQPHLQLRERAKEIIPTNAHHHCHNEAVLTPQRSGGQNSGSYFSVSPDFGEIWWAAGVIGNLSSP